MELYTGLRRLTIKNTGLRSIQPRAFDKNPHLRYIFLDQYLEDPPSEERWESTGGSPKTIRLPPTEEELVGRSLKAPGSRLTSAEDSRSHEPPDVADLERLTARPLSRMMDSPRRGFEFGGTSAAALATLETTLSGSAGTEQLEALERSKRDWEQEQEALEREREALE
uniref:Uncharacterized protein n=1 Tax=Sphaerodactylus townsendi TaxID=933632 RepID=A0ACB8E650_9SAUR